MALWRSRPQVPLRWPVLLASVAALWLAPIAVGRMGLGLFFVFGKVWADLGLGVWFVANALTFSPLFSWIGWLIALPMIWLALGRGWFGWAAAALIGAAAGAIAGELAATELALPFGFAALLALRLLLGRVLTL